VIEGVASLQEIETHYSLDDVFTACDALDKKIEAQRKAEQ